MICFISVLLPNSLEFPKESLLFLSVLAEERYSLCEESGGAHCCHSKEIGWLAGTTSLTEIVSFWIACFFFPHFILLLLSFSKCYFSLIVIILHLQGSYCH